MRSTESVPALFELTIRPKSSVFQLKTSDVALLFFEKDSSLARWS